MGTAAADTGPLNYLVLIEQIGILPALFDAVAIPQSVEAELSRTDTPDVVRAWISAPPPWLRIHCEALVTTSNTVSLDDGERDVIALAMTLDTDIILMDERVGVKVVRSMNLAVTGTLGLLSLGASRGLLSLADAFDRLRGTSFRFRPELLDDLLAAHQAAARGV